jgi:hypothetical protein
MTDEIKECYRLFELEPGAGAEAVKQAYRELLMVWHPDRFPDAKFQKRATEKTKALNAGYQKITAYLSGTYTESSASAKARAAAQDDMQAWEADDGFEEEEDFASTLKLAREGGSEHQIALAEFYIVGTEIPQNKAEAFRWLLAAASQGDSEGMYFVAKGYLEGLGVEQRGNVEMHFDGKSYPECRGVKRDKNEAIKWLSRLAYPETTEDRNCARVSWNRMFEAQILMAAIYYKIPGEPHDLAMAYVWLLLAIRYAQARVRITQCDGGEVFTASTLEELKEKLESELTAEQRAKGQTMAAVLFRPKEYLEAMAERRQKEQEDGARCGF